MLHWYTLNNLVSVRLKGLQSLSMDGHSGLDIVLRIQLRRWQSRHFVVIEHGIPMLVDALSDKASTNNGKEIHKGSPCMGIKGNPTYILDSETE